MAESTTQSRGRKRRRGGARRKAAPKAEPPRRGPGRPAELTREIMESMWRVRGLGLSIKETAESHGFTDTTIYDWQRRGEEDDAAGQPTIFAEFAHGMKAARPKGKAENLGRIYSALEATAPRKGKRVPLAIVIQHGKLALQLHEKQQGGARGAAKRWGKQPQAEAPPAHPVVDWGAALAKLESYEVPVFRGMLVKMGLLAETAPPAQVTTGAQGVVEPQHPPVAPGEPE